MRSTGRAGFAPALRPSSVGYATTRSCSTSVPLRPPMWMRSSPPFSTPVTRHRSRLAALLDRDGTIIVDRDYTNNPDDVRLLPGAPPAIRRLASAGYPAIVITNQSGIARGKVSLEQYRLVRQRLDQLLRAEGAELLDTFTCPHHPEIPGLCSSRYPDVALFDSAPANHEL